MCFVPNDDNENCMSIEDRHKVFVLYFEGLDRIGAHYGTSKMVEKAKELRLSIPSREEIESWKREREREGGREREREREGGRERERERERACTMTNIIYD